jgi:hypothetical protein
MCAAQTNLQQPRQNSSIAEQWATYPRNVLSLFEGEDLEDYSNFFISHGQRLFSPDKIRLAFLTARVHADQAVNGKAIQNVNSISRRVVNQRSIVSKDVTDMVTFDSAVEVSDPRACPRLAIALG